MSKDNTPSGPERSVEEMVKALNKIIDLYPNTEDKAIIALNDIRQTAFDALNNVTVAASPKGKEEETAYKILNEALQEHELKKVVYEIAWAAWKSAANAYRMYPDNKHTFVDYWGDLGKSESEKLLPPLLSTQQGERRFTLEEALELWECGYDNGFSDEINEETHKGDHGDGNFNTLKKKQYFKEKFNIDI